MPFFQVILNSVRFIINTNYHILSLTPWEVALYFRESDYSQVHLRIIYYSLCLHCCFAFSNRTICKGLCEFTEPKAEDEHWKSWPHVGLRPWDHLTAPGMGTVWANHWIGSDTRWGSPDMQKSEAGRCVRELPCPLRHSFPSPVFSRPPV